MENERKAFTNYITIELKLSKSTVDGYDRDIRQFCVFLQQKGVMNFIACTQTLISTYIDYLNEKGTSQSSLLRKLSALRSFFNYLQKYKKCNIHFTHIVNAKKGENKPMLLSTHEISRLLNAPDLKACKGIRDRAMLELLCATGIKVTELICLNLTDIMLDHAAIRCRHGNEMRIISFPQSVKKYIKKYITQSRNNLLLKKNEDAFFLNMSGERLTRQGFSKILRGYAEDLSLQDRITANSLRYTFAHKLVQKGLNLDSIKDILGHADTSTTKAFLKTAQKDTMKNKDRIAIYDTIGELT